MTTLSFESTLFDAIMDIHARQEEGVDCHCCGRIVKVRRRTISPTMARALVCFYVAGGTKEFVYGPSLQTAKGGDAGKLRYWGLIEPLQANAARNSGYWRVTKTGERFLYGKTKVQRYARVLNAECLGLDGERISITDILGEDFNIKDCT